MVAQGRGRRLRGLVVQSPARRNSHTKNFQPTVSPFQVRSAQGHPQTTKNVARRSAEVAGRKSHRVLVIGQTAVWETSRPVSALFDDYAGTKIELVASSNLPTEAWCRASFRAGVGPVRCRPISHWGALGVLARSPVKAPRPKGRPTYPRAWLGAAAGREVSPDGRRVETHRYE
jgi:hypothetical protein